MADTYALNAQGQKLKQNQGNDDKMFEIGRLCVKLAGRDAGRKCIIIEIIDSQFVMIDGQTRRRKCNIRHLEPLPKVLKAKKGASHEEVVELLKKEGFEVVETKPKEKTKMPQKAKIVPTDAETSQTKQLEEPKEKSKTKAKSSAKPAVKKEPKKESKAKIKPEN